MSGQRDININLLDYKIGRQLRRQKKILITVGYLGLGVLLIAGMFGVSLSKQDQIATMLRLNQQLSREIENQGHIKADVLSSQKLKSDLGNRKLLVQQIEKNQPCYVEMLQELDQMSLPGVFITSIEATREQVSLAGYLNPPSRAEEVISQFYHSEHFGEIINFNSRLSQENGAIELKLLVSWKEERA